MGSFPGSYDNPTTMRPAVLVKTRVWVKGCSVSRALKPGLGHCYLMIFLPVKLVVLVVTRDIPHATKESSSTFPLDLTYQTRSIG